MNPCGIVFLLHVSKHIEPSLSLGILFSSGFICLHMFSYNIVYCKRKFISCLCGWIQGIYQTGPRCGCKMCECLDDTSNCAGEERKAQRKGDRVCAEWLHCPKLANTSRYDNISAFCCLNKNPPGNQRLSVCTSGRKLSDWSWFPEVCNHEGVIRQEFK